MPLTPARCKNCGSFISADSSQKYIVCPYCRNKYLTKDAIKNFHNTSKPAPYEQSAAKAATDYVSSDFKIIGGILERYLGESTIVAVPGNVKEISSQAFSGLSQLTLVTLPEGLKTICDGAFKNCTSLSSIYIPLSVRTIGAHAFEGCSALTAINISDNVTEIGESAFFHCDALQEIVIPASVKKIAHGAFGWCSGLKKITILNPQCEIYDNATTLFGALDMSQSFYYVYKGTIRAYEDSSAEEHAAKYGIAFEAIVPEGEYLRGDVNGDGKVSLEDAQNCLQAYCRILSIHPHGLDDAAFRAADIDKSSTLSPEDATGILRYYTVSGLSGKPVSWKTLFQQNSD